jgi:hypothetical protein
MKKLLPILISLILTSCAVKNGSTGQGYEPKDGRYGSDLSIIQGKKEYIISKDDQDVELKKSPFTLEFTIERCNPDVGDFYAAEITLTDDTTNLKWFQAGPIAKDNPYFTSGTGNAGPRDAQYPFICLQRNGHEHVFYGDKDYRRADLIEELDDNQLRVKWDIDSMLYYKKKIGINELEIDEAYMMYFNDKNMNDTIESGEYHRIKLSFK